MLVKDLVFTFPFRPWVRSTSRRALLWGVIVVIVVGACVFLLSSGDRESWGRAFGVLLAYSLLFWVTLIKIWWTAGKPAVLLDGTGLQIQGVLDDLYTYNGSLGATFGAGNAPTLRVWASKLLSSRR